MKKIVLFVLALACFSSVGFAQVDKNEEKKNASFILDENGDLKETTAPIFKFDKETHDFGELQEGPKVKHEFKFLNEGKEPLIIKHVKASCGCTTPDWPKEPIMPGEEGVITAIYNTKKRPGPFTKAITITSNAYTPSKRLFIKGKVNKGKEEETSPVRKPSIVNEK